MGAKPILKHWAEAKDGKLKFYNEINFFQYLKGLDGRVYVIVAPEKKGRSDRQNRYYWAYLNIIADETGDDPDSLHEVFKRKFLSPKFVTVMGKEYKLPASTTKLSKIEFGEYIQRIEVMTGIPAPDPEQYFYQ